MEEHRDKTSEFSKLEAGRGIPLRRRDDDAKQVENQVESDNGEPLDERIRKAGI